MQLQDEDEYVLGYVYKRRSFKIRMSKEHGLITYVQCSYRMRMRTVQGTNITAAVIG
jgi:hypothetical protein